MKTLVLVHGAYHGGWCWQKLTPLLKDYAVFTPTLTGQGKRTQLLTPELTLNTHINDIVALITAENLKRVILVGHSYAGMIIAGVNEVIPEKIAQLVFLDAFIPQNNKSAYDIIDPAFYESSQYLADKYGDGWRLSVPEDKIAPWWGIDNPTLCQWIYPQLSDCSIHFLETPLKLSAHFDEVKKTYIHCATPSNLKIMMLPFYKQAREAGWPIFKIDTGHEPMLTEPEQLSHIITKIIHN